MVCPGFTVSPLFGVDVFVTVTTGAIGVVATQVLPAAAQSTPLTATALEMLARLAGSGSSTRVTKFSVSAPPASILTVLELLQLAPTQVKSFPAASKVVFAGS